MKPLRCTLVADGTSDRILVHPLRWLLDEVGLTRPSEIVWADLRGLPRPPTALEDAVREAMRLFPCDLLFVHRDAERESREVRCREIREAVRRASPDLIEGYPHVCIVPVRMTEAWFLFDEASIRNAAGNPGGTTPLDLPSVEQVEGLPDPKGILHDALQRATERPPRRLRRFSAERAVHRAAELIATFEPLRTAPAFAETEGELRRLARDSGWTS